MNLRTPLRPRALDARSPLWSFYVNTVGASALWSGEARQALYRRMGIDTRTPRVGPGCYVHSAQLTIGHGCTINHGVHFENVAPIELGEWVGIAPHALLLTSAHDIDGPRKRWGRWYPQPIRIGGGTWVGAKVVVLPGVTIGSGCLIAAGAVVLDDCEADGLYAGVPARRIRDLPADGERRGPADAAA